MMTPSERPIVVGGGVAGIIACLVLEEAGHAPLLLEAGDRLGGRLRTEHLPDGTPVDVGFQVLLTAYPELRRWVDFEKLEPIRFVPGAKILRKGQWKTLADPRRVPQWIFSTLSSGIGNPLDHLRTLSILKTALRGSDLSVQNGQLEGSTLSFLQSRGLSSRFISGFLTPFFSGIFLNRQLDPPPAQFLFTFRMFATGEVIRPKAGMQSLVDQLKNRLIATKVQLNSPVASVLDRTVVMKDGTNLKGAGTIITTPNVHSDLPKVRWNGCLNVVFECTDHPFGHPIIGLIPEAKTVTNLHFMEDVQGEEGRGKLNVTAVHASGNEWPENDWIQCVREDLRIAGIHAGRLLWARIIPMALPKLDAVQSALNDPRISESTYAAGDFTAAPSLDAAMRSGRVAAEAWLNDRAKA